ncbi:MAG: Abi family protein [Bacteroidales bacterium]|nr:Abi family protein [Bacteroidales bacterium]MCM1416168.1 Abi family protein [bacterium]MCM1424193.1 Abi family protein [bacterium]
MKSTNDKPFLTYEQQISKLTDKGLTISNPSKAISLLKKHSYFALISGYKSPFKSKTGKYKMHTTFDDIYTLYTFDDTLRTIVFQNILRIEKHIKSLISYSFCETYGESQSQYLKAANYNQQINPSDIRDLIERLENITRDPRDYSYIRHQKNHHGNIPLWVMMKALTLGTVSKFYSFLPQNIQAKVSIEFDYVTESELVRMLALLARVRNVCAHNERLYNYRYYKGAIHDTYIHEYLEIPKQNGQYTKGKQDLFAVTIVLKYLLDEQEFSLFINNINMALETLLSSNRQLQKSQMYKYMGFPVNWTAIKDAPLGK